MEDKIYFVSLVSAASTNTSVLQHDSGGSELK